jgi:hypothetical protein
MVSPGVAALRAAAAGWAVAGVASMGMTQIKQASAKSRNKQ